MTIAIRCARTAASALVIAVVCSAGCGGDGQAVLTFSGSAVGREADLLRQQLARFAEAHPGVEVSLRSTPDAADQRRQLYVQWLNGRARDPDVLQLDVVWTPEFAAAGWLADLTRFAPPAAAFFPAAIAASRWSGRLYAMPWFVDVGMLYWRTDLAARPPRDLAELAQLAAVGRTVPFGFVWQGARYEGLITVFLEHLGAFGGVILDEQGQVAVDSEAGRRALTYMRDAIYESGAVPQAVLTWQEEQSRFAFQNGQAMFMRNWPYAYPLLEDGARSAVAGRFAITSMPAAPGGRATATLGGSSLAINAFSDQADAAYALIEFLLQPEQMIERAREAGQYPARPELFASGALDDALPVPAAEALAVIERAVPRPVTPVYAQLSEILQISLHRALTRQQEPDEALHDAAAAMRTLLTRVKLTPPTS